jgi:hypothetical protein
MKKIWLFFMGLALLGFSVHGQTFSKEKAKLFSELKDLFNYNDREKAKQLSELMDAELKANRLTEERLILMQEFFNELAKKKYRVYPFYSDFLSASIISAEKQLPDSEFKIWHQAALYVLKKKPQGTTEDFLANSGRLFSNNVIYESSSCKWKVYGGFRFEFSDGKEPEVVFSGVNLVAYSRNDSALIFDTRGSWIMTENRWTGKGGQVYWERAGMPREWVNAKLNNYTISLKTAEYRADSVEFMHTRYLTKPILGFLEEKVLNNITAENASYPRFSGYDKRIKLDRLSEEAGYLGGFQFFGNKFIGSGDASNPALIIFNRNNLPFIKIASLNYNFKENTISSDDAEVTIYLIRNDTIDSLYQPGLNFKFITDKRELTLLRLGQGMQKSLYQNTFHKLDMDIEALYWKTGEDKIDFSTTKGASEGRANFYSANYFRDMLYEKLDGVGDLSPLYMLKQFYTKNAPRKTFTGEETAKYLRDDPSQVRQFIMLMSIYGLISYNVNKDEYVVKDRFFHLVNARSRLSDYDIIEFNSTIKEKNATLSLLDYNLKMRGVGMIQLSDSQQVVLYPKEQELVMGKNMDFSFDGLVSAGKFSFFGKNYDFNYENFKMNLPSVDSIRLVVKRFTPDENGGYSDVKVPTAIHDVRGVLEIDAPFNKSGIKSIGRFPVFQSTQNAYTYYENRSICGGVYKRDLFHFQIDPFEIDSLDEFPTENLLLDGTFTSGNIFPDFKEKLRVMPDYSLGIRSSAPQTGYPAYGGPARYFNTITMSHEGLRGSGRLEYLSSKTESEDFRFYPDSLNALAKKFTVDKTIVKNGTPDVKADSVSVHWEPGNGTYEVKNLGSGFSMYDAKALLNGKMTVTENGLKAGGKIDLGNAELRAEKFNLKPENILSDSTDFMLKELDILTGAQGISLKTANMKADVDFKLKKGKFEANDENAFVDFPINQYRTFSEKLDWDMQSNNMELRSKAEHEKEGFKLLSMHPEQGNLEFNSPYTLFNTNEKVLYAEKVKHIDVADSRLLIPDGKVVVRTGAVMDTLKNTQLLMPAEKTNHTLKEAVVKIGGKFNVAGEGVYEYKDNTGRVQNIRMNSLEVTEKKEIHAKGSIRISDSLKFMPHVFYKGDFSLFSQNPEPFVKGYISLEHGCPLLTKKWMETEGFIGSGEILLPVPQEARDESKNILFNGFAFASDSSGIYPVLISGKKNYADIEVVSASGYLMYDSKTGEYKVGNKERLTDDEADGNLMVFNPADCSAYGEGKLEIGGKLGQVNTVSAGRINYLPADTTTELDVVFGIDFFLDNSIWDLIFSKIKDNQTGSSSLSDPDILINLGRLIPDGKERDRFMAKVGQTDKLPSELAKTFLFTGVHLYWDKNKRSLFHDGNVGILSWNGKMYNRQALLKMEINRKRSGDVINLYIEFDANNWYYFNYRNNIMQFYSSHNTEINNKILELDAKRRTVEGGNGIPPYQFTLGTKRRVEQFLEQF